MAWRNAVQFDETMKNLAHTTTVGILLRDRGAGRVTINRDGVPVVHYQVSAYDQRHVRRGLEGAARVLQAAGARRILSSQNRPIAFDPAGPDSLPDWMGRVNQVGFGANQTTYFSWHQMGTCRIGRGPATSVVGQTGEVHAMKDLYIADASLFPSASGVNPMITIAALAHWVAQQIKANRSMTPAG
jgi:choline dehydrogenase-like flavoprotein